MNEDVVARPNNIVEKNGRRDSRQRDGIMRKNRQKQGHRPQRLGVQDLAAVRGGSVYNSEAIVGGGKAIVGGGLPQENGVIHME